MSKPIVSLSFGRSGVSTDDSQKLINALSKLKDVDKNKDIAGGMKRAGGLLRRRFKQGILSHYLNSYRTDPESAPSLYTSVKSIPKRGNEGSRRYIGFERGMGQHGSLAHLVDGGTKTRWQKTTGRYTGVMPATNFARDAFRNSVREMFHQIYKGVETALNKGTK